MPDTISSVYDIPDWLAKKFPSLTGPARAAYNTALLPIDAGADLLRRGTYGVLGLEEEGRGKFTDERLKNIRGALSDTERPFQAIRGGVTNAMEGLREKMIAAGGKPQRTDAVPPMNMGPGAIDAELRAGAPAMPRQTSAAPARQRGAPVPVDQSGAISTLSPGTDRQMPPATQPMGALAEAPAEAPRPSLMAQFRERTAAIPAADGKMSEEDKKQRQLEFFLNMLARGSQPGATFLPSMAKAGLDTSAGVRADREKAQTRAAAGRKEAREDVFREITFGDKDEDNRRGDKREDTRLKLLEKQINQGKVSVQKDASRGTYVILDATTGQSKDTGIKFPKDKTGGNANIELIEYIRRLPEGERELAMKTLGRAPKEGDDAVRVFDAAVKRVQGDLTGNVTTEQAVREAQEALRMARGGQQQLPKGVPPGSKQVGTSGGKPVYQAPDGKRYKVE
jgi:hypothetical protein